MTACGNDDNVDAAATTTPAAETTSGLTTVTGEIVAVTDGIDGSTVELLTANGTTVHATVSIPNLGPDTNFDFSALAVGTTITVTGDTFDLDGDTHLTASTATNASGDDSNPDQLNGLPVLTVERIETGDDGETVYLSDTVGGEYVAVISIVNLEDNYVALTVGDQVTISADYAESFPVQLFDIIDITRLTDDN